jgi:hypothetical protein
MTQQTINIGSAANDGTGDPLRTSFVKTNANFTELYAYAAPLDAMAYSGMQINGSMEVSQENGTTSRSTSGNVVDGAAFFLAGTMVVSAAQVGDAPPGLTNSIKLTVTTAQAVLGANDSTQIYMPIEGYRISRLAFGTANAQPISIGFWTKIHRTGIYSGAIRNSANNRSYPFSFTQNVADTWEYKTVTIPGDVIGTWVGNTNGVGLYIIFCMAGGATIVGPANAWASAAYNGITGTTNGVAAIGDVFQITGLVVLPGLEVPTAARSPFIMRSFDQELVICQRQFRILTPEGAGIPSGSSVYYTVRHSGMRSAPSIKALDALVVTSLASTFTQSSPNAAISANTSEAGLYVFGNFSGLVAGALIFANNSSTNRVQFDARL